MQNTCMHKLCLTCPVAGMLFRSVKTVPAGQTCQRRPYTPSGAVRHALTGGLRKVLKNCTLKIWKSGGGITIFAETMLQEIDPARCLARSGVSYFKYFPAFDIPQEYMRRDYICLNFS